MTEQDIANRALENLEQLTQIKGKWKPLGKKVTNKNPDGKIDFIFNGRKHVYFVQIKNHLRNVHLPDLFKQAKDHAPFMVIADQIFPNIKTELKNHNIAYLETNGNIWLKYAKGEYWVDINRALPEAKEKINRAFTKTGLKVVFDLLRDETLLNQPYREIAKRADIALGNINYILNGLKEKGFLLKLDKGTYQLNKKRDLLTTWITKYDEKLKPTLEIGTFRFLKPDDFVNWKNIKLKNGKTYWGGEPGGNLYTNYLKPAILTLYTTETRNDLIKNYRLIPDPEGNVKAFRKFWTYDEVNDGIAPPLLVYADLINTADHRCIETAQLLYDELLTGKF